MLGISFVCFATLHSVARSRLIGTIYFLTNLVGASYWDSNDMDGCQILLTAGANIEVRDEDGALPLHDACAGGIEHTT